MRKKKKNDTFIRLEEGLDKEKYKSEATMALKAWVMRKRMTPGNRKKNKQEPVYLCFNLSLGLGWEEEQRLAVSFWTWQVWGASIHSKRRCP